MPKQTYVKLWFVCLFCLCITECVACLSMWPTCRLSTRRLASVTDQTEHHMTNGWWVDRIVCSKTIRYGIEECWLQETAEYCYGSSWLIPVMYQCIQLYKPSWWYFENLWNHAILISAFKYNGTGCVPIDMITPATYNKATGFGQEGLLLERPKWKTAETPGTSRL